MAKCDQPIQSGILQLRRDASVGIVALGVQGICHLPGVVLRRTMKTIAIGASNAVTITIRWQPPKPASHAVSNTHRFVVVTSIN